MIQEIIILDEKGIPIFYQGFEEQDNSGDNYQVIASYFDQICKFTRYGFNENLTSIKMDKSVFYFYTNHDASLKLIVKCFSKFEEKRRYKIELDNAVNEIFERFHLRYGKVLKNFDGNISQFKAFSEEITGIVNSKKFAREMPLVF